MPTIEFRKSFTEIINNLNLEMVSLLSEKNDDFSNLTKNLHAFIHNRIDSLLLLVQHNCLWDADIILRPIAEASVKIAYLSCGTSDERNKKVFQFWNDLAEINQLKRSKQTKDLLDKIELKSPILSNIVLDQPSEKFLSEKWPKSVRQKIEQPWSYNEMIKVIAQNLGQDEILCLARNFTLSSHLIHADETALGVIHDRTQRNVEDREDQINLHEIRLFSDCLTLYSWNLDTLLNLFEIKSKKEIKRKIEEFNLLATSIEQQINKKT